MTDNPKQSPVSTIPWVLWIRGCSNEWKETSQERGGIIKKHPVNVPLNLDNVVCTQHIKPHFINVHEAYVSMLAICTTITGLHAY
jgi:hypothetical protein